MDQDPTELNPKGEIPTEAEFARLLCDRTFVDYFNVFLSFPVFAQRLLYKYSDQSFELDPPLKRTQYRLDRIKLMRWVRTKRAPWFFKSDLYVEFLLCKRLQKTQLHLIFNYGADTMSSRDKMIDHCLMTRWLQRVSGMRKFRHFICETAGGSLVKFWLDSEKFRRTATDDDEAWTIFYHRMEAKYFKSRELKLSGCAHFCQMKRKESRASSSTINEVTYCATDRSVNRETFLVMQGYILKTLQNYWVPRYLVHCKQRFGRFSQTTSYMVYRPDCYAIKVRSLSEITDDAEDEETRMRKALDNRSHHSTRKLQLLKQSVGNLMSMFSSPQVRCSELSSLLKVEDTGVRGGEAEDALHGGKDGEDSMTPKGQDWLTEEFPLPAISEESSTYERSSSASPIKKTPSVTASIVGSQPTSPALALHGDVDEREGVLTEETFRKTQRSPGQSPGPSSARRSTTPRIEGIVPDEDDEQLDGDQKMSPHGPELKVPSGRHSMRGSPKIRTSRHRSSSQVSSKEDPSYAATEDVGDRVCSEEVADELSGQESESSGGSAEDLAFEERERSPPTGEKGSPSITPGDIGTDISDTICAQTESGEMTAEKHEFKAQRDTKHRGNIADLTKYRRNSDVSKSSSRDSSSTSVGHSSVSSGSLISLSRRRMSVPSSSTPTRPQGVPKPPVKRRSRSQSVEFRLGDFSLLLDKREQEKKEERKKSSDKIKNPKLEADLIALQSLQQEREKRKKERLRQMLKAKKKKSKKTKQKKEAATEIAVSSLADLASGDEADTLVNTLKKLAMRRKGKAAPLAKINRTAFQKLEALHSISLSDKEKEDKLKQEKENGHIIMKTNLSKINYSELSFEDKLLEDDNRLMMVSTSRHVRADRPYKMIPLQSRELPNVNISKPRFFGYNLGESNYRVRNGPLVNAVISDKLAGGPWMKFLSRCSYTSEVQYLRFWHIAHEYIGIGLRSRGTQDDLLRQRLALEIITSFLKPTGERPVRLGRLLTAELVHQLPANSGDELLVHAQNLACEALRKVWAVFCRHDVDGFLSRVSERKNTHHRTYPVYSTPAMGADNGGLAKHATTDKPRTLSQVLAEARKGSSQDGDQEGAGTLTLTRLPSSVPAGDGWASSVAPHRMKRAVRLGVGASCLGWSDSDASDPSDPDDESDDEGSLRRSHMIVLRKRKIKSTHKLLADKVGEVRAGARTGQQARGSFVKRSSRGDSDTPIATERDGHETTKAGVCRAIRKGGKTIHRPSRPRSFMEVLHDQSHFEFFRRHLQVEVGNELPLSFWQAVEQLRMGNVRDPKVRQAKTQAIVKKYFNKTTNYGGDLETDADIIQDIPTMEKVTPQMLMSAQTCVAKNMEDKWYEDYKDSYTDDTADERTDEAPHQVQFGPQGRTRYLWNIFITNVCQFRKLLMTPWLLSLFKDYLGKEVQREVEKQRVSGVISKRIIGGKIVSVDKLQNDLCFWAEVERFKQLADNASRAAAAGTYTLEDEEYVQTKAMAIIDVFLDSFVTPRVQINVPQEIAEDIIDIAQHGIIERGLFHDAAIHTFTVLLYCWKKFTKERLSYKATPSSIEDTTISQPQPRAIDYLAPGEFGPPRINLPPKRKLKKKKKPSTPRVCGVKIKTLVGASSEDPPRIFFTIENGVQLIIPPKPQPEHESKERYRNLMRTLISTGHEESLLQLFQQQPAALGLGYAQQRRLSRSLGLQFPSLLKQDS